MTLNDLERQTVSHYLPNAGVEYKGYEKSQLSTMVTMEGK